MAHRPAALKSIKQDVKRNLANKSVKSRLRTEENKFRRMVDRGDQAEATKQMDLLTKLLQKAAAKNVLHANKAARRQALLQKYLNKAQAAKPQAS